MWITCVIVPQEKITMKLSVSPEQMANLSPTAKQRLFDWCKENDYGSTIDGEFVPTVQLSIGQMIHFLGEDYHHAICSLDATDTVKSESVCDAFFNAVKENLEQKN